ncbi:MAG: hypothetical protein ABIG61_07275 [Planctomycetota bacterium]
MDTSKIAQMNIGELREVAKKLEEMEIMVEQGLAREQHAEDEIADLNRLYEAEKDKVLAEQRKLYGLGEGVSAAIVIDGNDVVEVQVAGWWSRKQMISIWNPFQQAVRANHIKCSNEQAAKIVKEEADEAERLEKAKADMAVELEADENESEETNEAIDKLTQGDKNVGRNDKRTTK